MSTLGALQTGLWHSLGADGQRLERGGKRLRDLERWREYVPWPVGHVRQCERQVPPGDPLLQGLTAAENLTPSLLQDRRLQSETAPASFDLKPAEKSVGRQGERADGVTSGW